MDYGLDEQKKVKLKKICGDFIMILCKSHLERYLE